MFTLDPTPQRRRGREEEQDEGEGGQEEEEGKGEGREEEKDVGVMTYIAAREKKADEGVPGIQAVAAAAQDGQPSLHLAVDLTRRGVEHARGAEERIAEAVVRALEWDACLLALRPTVDCHGIWRRQVAT